MRYRVTTGGADVRERHRRLGELLFAALARPGYDVDLTHDPAAPGPSFVIAVPVGRSAPAPAPPCAPRSCCATPACAAWRARSSARATCRSPMPPSSCRCSASALRSDRRGRFTFAAVPDEPAAQLVVHAKARTFPFSVDGSDVELRLDLVAKG